MINQHMDKTLTIIVPAYNSAATIEKCLDSLYHQDIQDEVEILIVNDGSTDTTASIAQNYVDRHPSYRLISKENGGHGSAINVAAKIANGKYMKVIDSDDWVVNFCTYVKALRTATADVVFSHFYTVDPSGKKIREYKMHHIPFGSQIQFKDFWEKRRHVQDVCNFHGIAYKTAFYNATEVQLSEKISYEDQEYTTLPFAKVKTVLALDLHFYRYQIGTPGQSMSTESQIKNLGQMETVLLNIIKQTPSWLNPTAKSYFLFKKCAMLLSYYMAAMIKNPKKKNGRAIVKSMNKKIKQTDLALYKATRKSYRFCYILSYFNFSDTLKDKLQHFYLYRVFVRFLR